MSKTAMEVHAVSVDDLPLWLQSIVARLITALEVHAVSVDNLHRSTAVLMPEVTAVSVDDLPGRNCKMEAYAVSVDGQH